MHILPPSACTASVMTWCFLACRRALIRPANGATQPAIFGLIPPVTIKPAPPFARAA